MRTLLLCTLLFVFETASSQVIQLKDSRFTLLSAFLPINNDKKKIYQLALAKYKIGNQSGYAVLVENHVADFRFDLIDTADLELILDGYIERKRGSKTWLESESLTFKRMDVITASNSKGFVVAFPLTNEEAYDLKKDFLRNMRLYGTKTSENLSIDEPAMSLFTKNAAKITATKGSFDDVSRFKVKRIPLYSLMYKTGEEVAQKLGAATKTTAGPMGWG